MRSNPQPWFDDIVRCLYIAANLGQGLIDYARGEKLDPSIDISVSQEQRDLRARMYEAARNNMPWVKP